MPGAPRPSDFAERYRALMAGAARPARRPEHWDARASRIGCAAFDSAYVRGFLARMDLDGCATLLDVGCGPGTIALSVAPRLERVYGLDYSPRMLAAFTEHARARGLANATPILRAWDDDWSDVPSCDIVVASRSTAVRDLEAALLKLDAKARVRAYVTYPADGHLVPAEVYRALGRPRPRLPDYLFVVGILHDLGRYPTLAYLGGENRLAGCTTYESLRARVAEWVGPLTGEEPERLRRYYDENGGRMGSEPTRWALVSWEARERARTNE